MIYYKSRPTRRCIRPPNDCAVVGGRAFGVRHYSGARVVSARTDLAPYPVLGEFVYSGSGLISPFRRSEGDRRHPLVGSRVTALRAPLKIH